MSTAKQIELPDLGVSDSCLSHCQYDKTTIKCHGCTPGRVPNGTETVALVQLHPGELVPGRFCYVSWPYVSTLTITTKENEYFRLHNGVFNCLGYLECFRLNSPFLEHFENLTFSGLTNLTTFDLSGCNRISFDIVYETLSVSNNFPRLTHIILSSVSPHQATLIRQSFINALASRPIDYIDLSRNYVYFDFSTTVQLCKSLNTLIIRDGTFIYNEEFENLNCTSLRIYDDSGTGNPLSGMTCINTNQMFWLPEFFRDVRVLISNRKTSSPLKSVSNCTLDLFSNSSVQEFHFAENDFPSFEFKLVNNKFRFLNLSNNRIETIIPTAVKHLPSLTRLDLSNNYLYKTKSLESTFSSLFKYNTQLSTIDLSGNDLKFLPNETFAYNTHLEVIDLSWNAFDQIRFHFWNLPNLTTIDLSSNLNLKSFDSDSRRFLDDWYGFHRENNVSVNIILDGNRFSCSCSSKDFVEWFVNSPIFATSTSQSECQVEFGQRIPMTDAAVMAAQEDCDRIERERFLIIFIPICLALALVVAIIVYRRYRRNRRIKLQDDRIRLLRENEAQFAVFLSHSSDENDFVRKNILEPLQVRRS